MWRKFFFLGDMLLICCLPSSWVKLSLMRIKHFFLAFSFHHVEVRGLILGWIYVYSLCLYKNALVTIDIITFTQPYIIFPRDLNYLHWLCTYVQINKQQTKTHTYAYVCKFSRNIRKLHTTWIDENFININLM